MTRRAVFTCALSTSMLIGILSLSVADPRQAKPGAKTQQSLNAALFNAIRRHDVGATRTLLSEGADANARDVHAKADATGRARPRYSKQAPVALVVVFDEAVMDYGKPGPRVLKSARHSEPSAIVQALLDRGADPNVLDDVGRFPLLLALQNQCPISARLLLERGANPNQTWVHGITPLHIAVGNKDVITVKLLLSKGAKIDARSAFDNPAHPLEEEVNELLKAPSGAKSNAGAPRAYFE